MWLSIPPSLVSHMETIFASIFRSRRISQRVMSLHTVNESSESPVLNNKKDKHMLKETLEAIDRRTIPKQTVAAAAREAVNTMHERGILHHLKEIRFRKKPSLLMVCRHLGFSYEMTMQEGKGSIHKVRTPKRRVHSFGAMNDALDFYMDDLDASQKKAA